MGSVSVAGLANGINLGSATTNGSGVYTIVAPASELAGAPGVLTYLTGSTKGNTFADNNYSNMNIYAGSLSIISANSTNLSGINTALAATLGSNSGANFLFTQPSGSLSLTTSTNLSIAASAAAFTLDQPITGAANIYIQTPTNLTIANGNGLTAGAGDNITLVTSGLFINNAGANALTTSAGGQWLVYSQNPAYNTPGGLLPTFIQYNATYGATTPAQLGNGLLYTLAPTITASLTGTITKVFDGTNTATLSVSNLSNSGAIDGVTVTLAGPTSATYADSNVNTGIGVTANGISIASASNASIPVYGYQLASSSATGSIGAITAATLTYAANSGARTYGSTNPSFTGTVTGFVDNQTLASATTGSATFSSPASATSNVGTYAINGSGLTANNGDYVFVQAAGNGSALTINPATLTYVATPSSQPYGLSNNSFTGTVTGFVNNQTLASATTGSAAFTSATTASTAAGNYAIDGAGLTANHGNYVFTQAPTNASALTITPAAVAPPPPPVSTPTPTNTTIFIDINNLTAENGQTLNFTATYNGAAINGVNISALIAGLTYQVIPAFSGPGTYQITATGIAPTGYTLDIVPGTFTVLDSSPVTLSNQARSNAPETPELFAPSPAAPVPSSLQPVNSLGVFQINTLANGYSISIAGYNPQETPLAQYSFFTSSNDKPDSYSSGVKK